MADVNKSIRLKVDGGKMGFKIEIFKKHQRSHAINTHKTDQEFCNRVPRDSSVAKFFLRQLKTCLGAPLVLSHSPQLDNASPDNKNEGSLKFEFSASWPPQLSHHSLSSKRIFSIR